MRERERSPSLSRTRRKRHGSISRSHSKPRKRRRHSRSHSRDLHTNKGHYTSQSHSKARGSCSVLTSSHNASSHKGETSLTTACLKYCSRLSLRYRKGTSKHSPSHSGTNWRNNRSRSHSPTRSKRHESQSLSRSKQGRGGGRDLSEGIFTHTKSITDHDHVQMIQGIFTHTKSITDHDHVQLIQGIFTQTKSITDREHHHIRKPDAVTVICTPDFIHQIFCRQKIGQDHYLDCQYVYRKTVTNV